MVTKAVSMDLKVGAAAKAKQQDSDSGFSDVLGNVKSENRRQQGLTDSSRSDVRNRDFGKEFGFTQRASESTKGRDAGAAAADAGGSAKVYDSPDGFDVEAADRILAQAAEIVTAQTSGQSEALSKEEAAAMMTEALKTLKAKITDEDKDSDAELIDALMELIAAMTGNETESTSIITDEPVIEDFAVKLTQGSEKPMPNVSEKHDEAALITSLAQSEVSDVLVQSEEVDEMPETAEETGMQAAEQNVPTEAPVTFAEQLTQAAGADAVMTDETAVAREIPVSQNEAAMPEEALVTDSEEQIVVDDTVKLLAEIIDDAKRELGLTEFSIEKVADTSDQTAPMMQADTVGMAQRVSRSDHSGELDHILNGSSPEVNAREGEAPKTETYDAVHMAAELMTDRMHVDVPTHDEMPEHVNITARPPEVQTAEQILERIRTMQEDQTEFTMVLNPESLGRITVKLVTAGERVAVEINAENPDTRALLAARSESLQNMLRDGGVQLERYQIVEEREDTQFSEQSYEGSSKNPYGRNDEEQQQPDEDGESFYDLLQSI